MADPQLDKFWTLLLDATDYPKGGRPAHQKDQSDGKQLIVFSIIPLLQGPRLHARLLRDVMETVGSGRLNERNVGMGAMRRQCQRP
jgi:hypothetical protein